MQCRAGCGACCIAPSITSPIPGLPDGKPAGQRCVHLNDEFLCELFGREERPLVCELFQASPSLCGENRDQALTQLAWLEQQTDPDSPAQEN